MSVKMTFDVDNESYIEFKLAAVRQHTSMSEIVNMLIKKYLLAEKAVLEGKDPSGNSVDSTDLVNSDSKQE